MNFKPGDWVIFEPDGKLFQVVGIEDSGSINQQMTVIEFGGSDQTWFGKWVDLMRQASPEEVAQAVARRLKRTRPKCAACEGGETSGVLFICDPCRGFQKKYGFRTGILL